VLAAYFLQVLVNKGKDLNLLQPPVPLLNDTDFPIIQYADDTLIIMEGDPRQLVFLKTVLQNFSDSTGLKVNYNKSMMVPINMSEQRLDLLARTFGCSKGTLPFTYLGLPLGTTKPRIADFMPLVNKCERRLGGISAMLNQAGRLQITNAVLSALPTFYMCTLEIPKAVIKQIDKFRKNCLWRASNVNGRTQPKAAWKLVCRPKIEGGLGIINLEDHNQALLMKSLDKFFNMADIPWVNMMWEKHYKNGKLPSEVKKGSFWWRDILKLLTKFKQLAQVQLGNGKTCYFWEDQWTTQTMLQNFPQAHSFAKNKRITVHSAFNQEETLSLFNLPLSQQAFQQVTNIQRKIDSIELNEQDKDIWTYFHRKSAYKSATAYKMLRGRNNADPIFRWIWKSYCQPKHRVFAWLLVQDRLSTRNVLRRKRMILDSYNCEFCHVAQEETTQHLFWECPFAQQCWGILNLQTDQTSGTPRNFQAIKDQLNSRFFVIPLILMCWTIWKVRNELIFNNNQVGIQETKCLFFKEAKLVSLRMNRGLSSDYDQWIQNLA
jgi:hypothetical protein